MTRAATVRIRLDQLLVERGLAETRSRAQALVLAGRVRVGEGGAARTDRRAGEAIPDTTPVEIVAPLAYVSRGGEKLAAALDAFGVDPAGRTCLDVGASTGGFTDCLLQRGAARVHAVDVGRGQLADRLARDPRVIVHDRVNARSLEPGMLAAEAGAAPDLPNLPDLAVVDVSFISLALVLPAIGACLAAGADVVALVKPQFEAGRSSVPGGVVRDPEVHRSVLGAAVRHARDAGLVPVDLCASPLLGPAGNREFFIHAVKDGGRHAVRGGARPAATEAGLEARIAALVPG